MDQPKSLKEPVLSVVFYRTEAGNQPVRECLKGLKIEDRKTIGENIKTAQFGWPLGMPLIKKVESGIWEVRSNISQGIARMLFTLAGNSIVLLHGFVKKSQKIPAGELTLARQRLSTLQKE
jgi:phage-related protein